MTRISLILCLTIAFLCVRVDSSTLYFQPKESDQPRVDIYPFQNTSLPFEQRVDDLVSRLTLEEIQEQMARGGAGNHSGPAPAIPRLGIGAYQWSTECLRGDVGAPGNATAFPQAIGLAATFSPDLLRRVAAATGTEVRGKHNDFVKQGSHAKHTGASCFSPVINIARDPRWGRIQETYGEDPFLSGILSQNFVKGLQGDDSRFVQATAGCKHFDVHGGPENIPVSRFSFDAQVSDQDWRMTFLPAFRMCVEAGTFSLMCSYNRINGVPACANGKLLTDILRKEWGFKGYVVSDAGAIENIIKAHHYLNNSVDTVAACVKAGCNLELSGNMEHPLYESLVDAVNQGKLTEAEIRESVKPLFYTRMKLGEFDPPDKNPYAKLDSSVVETQAHRDLAVEAAVKSFVLLKNKNNFLPLKPESFKKVAIVGPMADNYEQLFGDYSPVEDRSFTKTPLQGLQELWGDIKYGQGCKDGPLCREYNVTEVLQAATGADLVFVTMGTGQALESEGKDRDSLYLSGSQMSLPGDVFFACKDAKMVLLVFNAGPVNLTMFDLMENAPAILELFLPAQATGDALVTVLTNKEGKGVPAGRLPITWPRYDFEIPPMVNYSMEGRTYRYAKTEIQYPFGYGLSYTTFEYLNLEVTWYPTDPTQDAMGQVDVKNLGTLDADEVVQCYIQWTNHSLPVPIRQLAYFDRVHIPAGQEVSPNFTISAHSWAYWQDGDWITNPGTILLTCGGQQPNQTRTVPSNIVTVEMSFTPSPSTSTSTDTWRHPVITRSKSTKRDF